MSFNDFFQSVQRRDQNAAVIFDHEEPVGRATDLVMPRRRFLDRMRVRKSSPTRSSIPLPNEQ